MTNLLTMESKKYSIKIENYEGPLDLLCNLVEKNKMDIYDINLSEITDQYIEYINRMQEQDLEVTSEFIIMASNLLYLKSKNLLPSSKEDKEEITEEELIRRIVEYKKYKDITEKLRMHFEENSNKFFKIQEQIKLPNQYIDEEFEKNIIPKIYEGIINKNEEKINQNAKNIEKIALTENFTVASKLKDMFRELIRHKKFVFNKLFSPKKNSNNEIVTAFSGLLELSRRNKVVTCQEELFGDINVEKNSQNHLKKVEKYDKTNIE